MTQQKNTGLRLRRGKEPHSKDRRWILNMAVAMLSGLSLTLILCGITGNGWTVMLAVTLWLCAMHGVLSKMERQTWFYLGVLAFMLVLVLVFRRQVLEGFRYFWNTAGDALVRGTGCVLPEWELQLAKEDANLSMTLFAVLAACGISLICCGLTAAAPALLAVLLPVILILGMSVFGSEESFLWGLPTLAVAGMILMYSGWKGQGSGKPILMSWLIGGIVGCLLVAFAILPGPKSWSQQVCENVHEKHHEKKYETHYTTLPEGDFSDYINGEQKPKQALAVTMEKPQQLYLRGFTGANFDGQNWEPLDRDALAKNKSLLYWLNLNVFHQNAQFDAAARLAGLTPSTVTVQNLGACSYYRYAPFSVGSGDWADAQDLNTDGIHGNGQRSYVYSVTAGTAQDILQVLTLLQTSEDPGILRYRKAESGYRQFIYHYYLQVPEEVKTMLGAQWDEIAARYGSADNLTQQQAQECTLIFLSRCFPEEGTPEDMDLPLSVAKGTTYQYATVAAMTLRYFGIPARYAEGYVISKDMAESHESGQTIAVDSSCASAWVEVYQDGIGWIPMELTPGIGQILEDQQSEGNNKNGTSNKDSQEEKEEDEPQEEDQPDPLGGSMVTVALKTILWTVVIVLAILLAMFLALWLRRKVLLDRMEKKFQSQNISESIAWIYSASAMVLEELGYPRGNGSMRQLHGPLEEKFGPEFAAQFDTATDLNDRALFSSLPMNEHERKAAQKFHRHTLRKLQSECKWYKRLWLKWVRCLY